LLLFWSRLCYKQGKIINEKELATQRGFTNKTNTAFYTQSSLPHVEPTADAASKVSTDARLWLMECVTFMNDNVASYSIVWGAAWVMYICCSSPQQVMSNISAPMLAGAGFHKAHYFIFHALLLLLFYMNVPCAGQSSSFCYNAEIQLLLDS